MPLTTEGVSFITRLRFFQSIEVHRTWSGFEMKCGFLSRWKRERERDDSGVMNEIFSAGDRKNKGDGKIETRVVTRCRIETRR